MIAELILEESPSAELAVEPDAPPALPADPRAWAEAFRSHDGLAFASAARAMGSETEPHLSILLELARDAPDGELEEGWFRSLAPAAPPSRLAEALLAGAATPARLRALGAACRALLEGPVLSEGAVEVVVRALGRLAEHAHGQSPLVSLAEALARDPRWTPPALPPASLDAFLARAHERVEENVDGIVAVLGATRGRAAARELLARLCDQAPKPWLEWLEHHDRRAFLEWLRSAPAASAAKLGQPDGVAWLHDVGLLWRPDAIAAVSENPAMPPSLRGLALSAALACVRREEAIDDAIVTRLAVQACESPSPSPLFTLEDAARRGYRFAAEARAAIERWLAAIEVDRLDPVGAHLHGKLARALREGPRRTTPPEPDPDFVDAITEGHGRDLVGAGDERELAYALAWVVTRLPGDVSWRWEPVADALRLLHQLDPDRAWHANERIRAMADHPLRADAELFARYRDPMELVARLERAGLPPASPHRLPRFTPGSSALAHLDSYLAATGEAWDRASDLGLTSRVVPALRDFVIRLERAPAGAALTIFATDFRRAFRSRPLPDAFGEREVVRVLHRLLDEVGSPDRIGEIELGDPEAGLAIRLPPGRVEALAATGFVRVRTDTRARST